MEMAKTVIRATVVFAAIVLALSSTPVEAEESWKSLKRESKRMKIDETAAEALETLVTNSAKAELLLDNSYGWAVFDNLKLAFGFSGGGGNGVATIIESGDKTYMKMGTVGIGLGLGANTYQVVFLFQDEQTFRSFVDKGWQADAGASAVAGSSGAEAKTDFTNGLAIFQITDKGLMLHADIAGTKYWKNKKLNRGK
jgi:lipid-binding SYLF domain-containing protein